MLSFSDIESKPGNYTGDAGSEITEAETAIAPDSVAGAAVTSGAPKKRL